MGKGSIPKELWETYRAMSVDVGRQIPFLKDTSCMNQEERLMLAFCNQLKTLFNEDKEFIEFLDVFVVPMFSDVGRAKWGRDVVSDLGFALSGRSGRKLKVKNLLEFQVKKKEKK